MTVTELIEQLKDEPRDWQVHVTPVHVNQCGLPAAEHVPGRVTGREHSKRDRHPDGSLKDAAGNLAPCGVVYLGVYDDGDVFQ